MPSHHHRHQQCCCCPSSCCCSSPSPTPTPSPPTLTTSDQLLQALAAHLVLQSPTPSPPPPLLYSHHYLKSHQTHHVPVPTPIHHPKDQQQPHHQNQTQTQTLLRSLLNRVSALESSLPHLSSSPPPPQSPRQPTPTRPSSSPHAARSPSLSLRDLAARTIQTHFRRLLVRRSQALRHLKRLAVIKSHVAALRSSLSDKTHHDHPKTLSEKAMDLLLELDSIQSRDPTIREGRRSISRELVRILEFIDKVLVRERQEALEAIEIAANGGNRGAPEEDLSKGIEGIEGCPGVFGNGAELLQSTKPTKRVSFLENGRRPSASVSAYEPFLEEFSDSIDQRGPVGRLGRDVRGIAVAEHLEAEGSHQFSDEENSSEGSAESGGSYGEGRKYRGQNGTIGLSAPLPVQMEPRRSHSNKRMASARS